MEVEELGKEPVPLLLFHCNSKWNSLGLNPGVCGNKPETKELNLGTVLVHVQSRLSTPI